MGALAKAAAGQQINSKIRIEFGGDQRPPDGKIAQVNDILKEISDKLRLK